MKMNTLAIILSLLSLNAFSQTKFNLNLKESKLIWKGSGVIGGSHKGTLKFSSGNLSIADDHKIFKGEFVINMNSLKDSHDTTENDLVKHLKSNDFFAVDKFPKAYFSIFQVSPASQTSPANTFNFKGLLTIKGVTNTISFTASVIILNSKATVTGVILINRTLWGITYNSPSFFSIPKDDAISDTIEINLDLILKQVK